MKARFNYVKGWTSERATEFRPYWANITYYSA